jgi:type IV pilus assembly protein PilQ
MPTIPNQWIEPIDKTDHHGNRTGRLLLSSPRLASTVARMLHPERAAAVVAAGLALQGWPTPVAAQALADGTPLLAQVPQALRVDPLTTLQLKVRRLPNAIELIIEGTGPGPQLQQASDGASWQGQLFTAVPAALRAGPQRLALPEMGLQAISFDGVGQAFSLSVTPTPGITLGRPVVSADGRDLIVTFASPVPQASLQTSRPNMAQPGAVPLPTFAPPLQPRAVPPPLGDMAVGTMTLRNPGYLDLPGPPVTMTMKNAPAKDALMALAQAGGYGFAYVEEEQKDGNGKQGDRAISLTFKNEAFGRAFNSALLAGGLQARRDGNMILAGPGALGKAFGPQVSKVFRLNQSGPIAAADYLATLGATAMRVDTITTSVSQGVSEGEAVQGAPATQTTESSARTFIEEYRATTGPLAGLRVTTDTRLATITLVGDPTVVSIAEQYLKKLDLRQRQVALSVRILDVTLDNKSDIDNSFAIRWGNNFIVNDSGQLLGAFGRNLPPSESYFARNSITDSLAETAVVRRRPNPGSYYPSDQFFDFLRAQIVSGSTKLLASPTLILQENPSLLREGAEAGRESESDKVRQGIVNIGLDGAIGRRRANEGVVRVGTNVVTDYQVQTTQGAVACVPKLSTSGLVLGARVEKIDDNGFVTFVLSPSVSAITGREPSPQGCGADLNILSIRSLDTGALRVRDGQTLIMTGVISDFDRQEVSKWPVLGDMPLIGQFFRATLGRKEKRELVIMVTPRIINDEQGGVYGYGYQPGTAAGRDFLGAAGQGFGLN